jgi:hypothetical protein
VLGMACDEAQGFHISRPLPSADVPAWLLAHGGMPARCVGEGVTASGKRN